MYYFGEYVQRDINKAIDYLILAGNQNISKAWLLLGNIYYNENNGKYDINKAIQYFTYAANLYNSNALLYLGSIYYNGVNIQRDVNKGIDYIFKSAKLGNLEAEYIMGQIYLFSPFIPHNIKKGIYFLNKSAEKEYRQSQFLLGHLYFSGKYVEKDINKAIFYYKEVSNMNNNKAKNNLGIIYKVGFDNIKQNIVLAKEYLSEASKRNDSVAKYNLSSILYEEEVKNKSNNDKSIQLLIESFENGFKTSKILFILIFLKQFGMISYTIFQDKMKKYSKQWELLSKYIYKDYVSFYLYTFINNNLDEMLNLYLNANIIYIINKIESLSQLMKEYRSNIIEMKELHKEKVKNINELFYEGFELF